MAVSSSPRSVQEVAQDIRSLRIQGARRIARASLDALASAAAASKAKNPGQLYEDLLSAARLLEATRPTEPMMRNSLEDCLRYTLAWARTHPTGKVEDIRQALREHQHVMLEQMQMAAAKIAKYGAAEIGEGAHVLIHCHSTTLIGVLIEAHKQGKNIEVTCLETRPLFQGRLSARDLTAAGVPVKLAVDSAMGDLISKMDLVMVGADAITSEGDLVNKVGTHTLAQLAFSHSVKFLCVSELFKYDTLTRWGRAEPMEQREAAEVWGDGRYAQERMDERASQNSVVARYSNSNSTESEPDAPWALPIPPGLRILNPAFDRTAARLISAYVTEEGLTAPAQLSIMAEQKIKRAAETAGREKKMAQTPKTAQAQTTIRNR